MTLEVSPTHNSLFFLLFLLLLFLCLTLSTTTFSPTWPHCTAGQLTERLCLCIHSLLDPSGKDSQYFQQLSESRREEMLLHLAEPLQFLHCLDLAHVFEYYYR